MITPNFVTQLARNTYDQNIRVKPHWYSYIMDSLPGASNALDPMRNVLGDYIHKPQNTIGEGIAPITIAPANDFKHDPVMAELGRLYEATGFAAGVTNPAQISGGSEQNGFYDPRAVKLEDGRSLFDHIMRARQEVNPYTGQSLRQALDSLFKSDLYKSAVDGDASNLYNTFGQLNRGAMVSQVFSEYSKWAEMKTAQESPIAKRYLAVSLAKKTDDSALDPYSATHLANDAGLLKALNIDINLFESKVSGQ